MAIVKKCPRFFVAWITLTMAVWTSLTPAASQAIPPATTNTPSNSIPAVNTGHPVLQLGVGDSVSIQVYGQPDMGVTAYVSDDGTIPVPLVGAVRVKGLSPSQAAQQIEKALKDGMYLNDPHVTLTVTQSLSQRVSVLGAVNNPGRYPVEGNTSIYDIVAQAGGTTKDSADTIYIVRPNKDGTNTRIEINLKALSLNPTSMQLHQLQAGDSVVVPRAKQFYIYGAVHNPGMYQLEADMNVEQAIVRAGGITERGSSRRIEIKRTESDGKQKTRRTKLSEKLQADDVIQVKESIF